MFLGALSYAAGVKEPHTMTNVITKHEKNDQGHEFRLCS